MLIHLMAVVLKMYDSKCDEIYAYVACIDIDRNKIDMHTKNNVNSDTLIVIRLENI
jgi:hypothetical protein